MARGDFSVRVVGFNRVRNNLRRLVNFHPDVTTPVMKEWGQETRKTLKGTRYPPKRPGQKYVRTGRLASSWRAEVNRGAVSIFNTAKQPRQARLYAGYVVGDDQAWMHKGRWWQARDIIQKQIPKLTDALTRTLEKIWSG